MHKDLERFFISKQSGALMPLDAFEKTLSAFFPQKTDSAIIDLLACVRSSAACTGKDVEVSRLFDNESEIESSFLQLLWRQGLDERVFLSQTLQVSKY